MTFKSFFTKTFSLVVLTLCNFSSFAQGATTEEVDNFYKKSFFYDSRGTNVIEVGVGASIINGALRDPVFEISSRIGYKRYIFPHLNIGLTYNKFNLAFKDGYNEGFMSFDLNLEYVISPYRKFSPFLFAGGGYNASNDFVETATRLQAGGGIEIIAAAKFGLKIMGDYNYVLSDEFDGKLFGASENTYWRILFGVNFYFGGQNKKESVLKGLPTIINSNPIISEN